MNSLEDLRKMLEELGLGKTEASAYLQLLLLSEESPATGYQVAKGLGKDPNTVYRALEDLEKRGAVETSEGRGKEFRPIPPGELMAVLKKEYESRIQIAEESLRAMPKPSQGSELYRLSTVGLAEERFSKLLNECERIAVLDLSPGVLSAYMDGIRAALKQGVTVVAKLYEEPDSQLLEGMENLIFTVEPDGLLMQELMPGPTMRGVFDCQTQLMAYLPTGWSFGSGSRGSAPLAQAFWSGSPLLAYQAHNGLTSEIIHTELRAMLRGGNMPDEMQGRQDWLARKIHGAVDWEGFWVETGLAGGDDWIEGRREEVRTGMIWGDGETTGILREGGAMTRDRLMEELVRRMRGWRGSNCCK